MEYRFFRCVVLGPDHAGNRRPVDFDTPVKMGLGPRHAIKPRRLECGAFTEDLRIGMESNDRAAPVLGDAGIPELAGGFAPGIGLNPQLALARHLGRQFIGQRIDHRKANTMEAARGLIDLGRELAARMERDHDHLKGGFVLELGMRVNGDTPAVVVHRHPVVRFQGDFDARCFAGHHLVHGVIQDFGRQVMHGGGIGAADIHGGPPPNRFEAFQDLDILCGITRLGFPPGLSLSCLGKKICHY